MNKRLLIFMVLFFFVFSSFISLNAQWARTYGGSKNDLAYCTMELDEGGYIVAGSSSSFGEGDSDVWVLKLNSEGNILWQRTYGGSGNDWAVCMVRTYDGGYIVAGTTYSFGTESGDIWILKLDIDGNVDWNKTYGGPYYDLSIKIQQSEDGGYILAGATQSFGSGGLDVWVLKLNNLGETEWQNILGGDDSDYPKCFQQTQDGGFILCANTRSFGFGNYDIWIIKFDENGYIEWQQTYGSDSFEISQYIEQTSDGGYIIGGYVRYVDSSIFYIYILKLDEYGEIIWQRRYEGDTRTTNLKIHQTSDGGYIFGANTNAFGSGGYDILVSKIDSSGDIQWQRTYGDIDKDEIGSISQTFDGGFVVSGYTRSFGIGEEDIWILKVDTNGNIDPSCDFIKTPNVSISETYFIPMNISVSPQNINILPQSTEILTQDTDAIEMLLCFHAQTPEELIKGIQDKVRELVADEILNKNQAKPLIEKLDGVLNKLEKDNTQEGVLNRLEKDNARAACNQLGAFINQVNAYINSGILTIDEGQELIKAANRVISDLCE